MNPIKFFCFIIIVCAFVPSASAVIAPSTTETKTSIQESTTLTHQSENPKTGFFTKKFDKWILLALISFHCANLFLLDISFVEQSLIFAPFLPWKRMAKYVHSK